MKLPGASSLQFNVAKDVGVVRNGPEVTVLACDSGSELLVEDEDLGQFVGDSLAYR